MKEFKRQRRGGSYGTVDELRNAAKCSVARQILLAVHPWGGRVGFDEN